MKLTKEIIRLFKYHGFMTVTAPDEDILKCYRTVEDLTNAGFVNDPEALRMAKMVFVEDGTPAVGPTKDEDVVETPVETVTTTTEEPVIDPRTEKETETETTTTDPEPAPETVTEPEPENAPEFDGAGFTEADNEPVTESGPAEEPAPETPTEEPVTEPEPEKEQPTTESEALAEEPKPKTKKTTTKKSTKKES